MNPITNAKNLQKINERELELGLTGTSTSWHSEYKDSAWIFVGGLPYDLTEGDVVCVFSQYGEIVNINLVRDKDTGKSKGFGFICYEDQRSTILAVDNLNTIKVLGRIIRVDHVKDYKPPKDFGTEDEMTQKLRSEGCAPKIESAEEDEDSYDIPTKKIDKGKKKKKKKDKKLKKEKRSASESADSGSEKTDTRKSVPVKTEKEDPGYDKYAHDRGRDVTRTSSSSRASHHSNPGERERSNSGRARDSRQNHYSSRDHQKQEAPHRGRNRDYEMEKHDRYREKHSDNSVRGKVNQPENWRREGDEYRQDRNKDRDSHRSRDGRRERSRSPVSRDRHRERARSSSRERYRR